MSLAEDRLSAVEAELERLATLLNSPTRVQDHAGISIVPGEGLKGGGTIDKTRALSIDIPGLSSGAPRADAQVAFWSEEERELLRCDFEDFCQRVMKFSGIDRKVEELSQQVALLGKKVAWLSIYERLEQLEVGLEAVEVDVDDLKEKEDAERSRGQVDARGLEKGALRTPQGRLRLRDDEQARASGSALKAVEAEVGDGEGGENDGL